MTSYSDAFYLLSHINKERKPQIPSRFHFSREKNNLKAVLLHKPSTWKAHCRTVGHNYNLLVSAISLGLNFSIGDVSDFILSINKYISLNVHASLLFSVTLRLATLWWRILIVVLQSWQWTLKITYFNLSRSWVRELLVRFFEYAS